MGTPPPTDRFVLDESVTLALAYLEIARRQGVPLAWSVENQAGTGTGDPSRFVSRWEFFVVVVVGFGAR